MSLVPSLLQAIVHVDGEALVIHAGEKPYVVTPKGQVQIASRALTLEAVSGIVSQLLPVDSQRALDEFGAAQYELPPLPEFGGERFTVVAARGGDDVWIEIRRRRVPDEDRLPDDLFGAPPLPGDVASQSFADDTVVLEHLPIRQQPEIRSVLKADDDVRRDDALSLPDESQLFPGHVASATHAEVDEDLPMRPVGRGEEPAAIPATSRVAATVKPST